MRLVIGQHVLFSINLNMQKLACFLAFFVLTKPEILLDFPEIKILKNAEVSIVLSVICSRTTGVIEIRCPIF